MATKTKPQFTDTSGVVDLPKYADPDKAGWRNATWQGAELTMSPTGAVLYRVGYKKLLSPASFVTIVKLAAGDDACSKTPLGRYMLEQAAAQATTNKGRAGPSTQAALNATLADAITRQSEAIAAILAKLGQ